MTPPSMRKSVAAGDECAIGTRRERTNGPDLVRSAPRPTGGSSIMRLFPPSALKVIVQL